MSDAEDNDALDYNPLDHQGCYIFTPSEESLENATSQKGQRGKSKAQPRKRRKVQAVEDEIAPKAEDKDSSDLFPQLFSGSESKELRKLRWETFSRTWEDVQSKITDVLESQDLRTINAVKEFVAESAAPDAKIPSALVMAGSDIAGHGPLFERLRRYLEEDGTVRVVLLSASDGGGLKGALKKIIRDGTSAEEGGDEDEDVTRDKSGRKMLNYDLRILAEWCQRKKTVSKIVVSIQDIEAFDSEVFSDLVNLLSAYLDRIPFVLLLGIATSLEIFHERTPKRTIRLLRGTRFDVEKAEEGLERVFNTAVIDASDNGFFIGPNLSDWIIKRQQNHSQSIHSVVASLKYAYMSHFFANPLSVLLAAETEELVEMLSKEHMEAIRNTPGFKKLVEERLEARQLDVVRALLEYDGPLRDVVLNGITKFRDYASRLVCALKDLEITRSCTSSQQRVPRYELYIKALGGSLATSPLLRDLLLVVKKMDSDTLSTLLSRLIEAGSPVTSQIQDVAASLQVLIDAQPESQRIIRLPAANAGSFTPSKRFQAQSATSYTPAQQSYSAIVGSVQTMLQQYFTENLVAPPTFLREAFMYDQQSPHKEVLTPYTRSIIENGLFSPTHYLACDCCVSTESEEDVLTSTFPPTSILYRLYIESGPIVNIYDFWQAFWSVLSGSEEGELDITEEEAQALFYRGIAELRYMGFLKYSRGRKDCLVKVAWKGL